MFKEIGIATIMVVIIAAIVATVGKHFTEGKNVSLSRMIAEALAVGAGLTLLNQYLIQQFKGLSWLWLTIALAFIVGLMYQWHREGYSKLEFACFTVLTLIAGGIAAAAGANYVPKTVLPLLVAILLPIFAIGFYAFAAFKFRCEEATLPDDERKNLIEEKKNESVQEMDKKARKWSRLMAAVAVITLLVMVGTTSSVLALARNGAFDGAPEVSAEESSTQTADAADTDANDATAFAETTNWHFYNNDVQGGKEDDDFNFGPEPTVSTAMDYDKDFRRRLEDDPALGAADIAWADAWLGTRYLGEFYESCNEDWAKTINMAKETWIKDPEAYNDTLDAFFMFLNTADVNVTAGNGLEDQMYMNPYTVDGIPDVIVLETPDHTGKFLTYTFTIKGTGKVKVSYRIECGYQPTNVEEVMGITPQEKPSKSDNGNTPGKGDNPTPTPTPTPKPTKEPSQDPVNQGNANKGGGQNKPSDGSGENQPTDPRTEKPTGPQNDNNHGYSDPATVTPPNPSGTTDSNPMTYKPDPVTNNGPADSSKKPTSSGGDGEFTPSD